MKSSVKKVLSLVMSAIMTFTVLSFGLKTNTANAAKRRNTELYGPLQEYEVKSGNVVHQGYILTPKEPGTYPVVVMFHGGTGHRWTAGKDMDMAARMNTWTSKGYIKPMIIILPTLVMDNRTAKNISSDMFYGYVKNKLGTLKNAFLGDKKYSKYFDPGKTWTVSGYSMGGAAALYAGTLYKNLFVNVGGLSPSAQYYIQEGRGWISQAKNLTFTRNSNAHLFMGYSLGERPEFPQNVKRFDKAFRANGFNFKIYVSPEGTHSTPLFRREMLAFFYYVSNNVFLTDDVVGTMKY